MITIGQLASFAGCTVKAVRTYHARGLLPEPPRDAAGYRRYDARSVVDLVRIVTLVRSGVPLAQVPAVLGAGGEEQQAAVERIDADLGRRIEDLRHRREQLRLLRAPDRLCLPERVVAYLERLRALGVAEAYVAVERDGWILAAAVAPASVGGWLPVKERLLDDPGYVEVLRGYAAVLDAAPDDPRLDALAAATAALVRRTPQEADPADVDLPRAVLDLLASCGTWSPAWAALGERVGRLLAER
ncbi:MerR family transcriptional regulator [Kineococcus glutinatus]|uniref:HTH merR-type domain-containing protein n=1 Tax=Kineococcus glutinatus TaxID=1070872 RepID=A0ABP9H7F3_9ACTN